MKYFSFAFNELKTFFKLLNLFQVTRSFIIYKKQKLQDKYLSPLLDISFFLYLDISKV